MVNIRVLGDFWVIKGFLDSFINIRVLGQFSLV